MTFIDETVIFTYEDLDNMLNHHRVIHMKTDTGQNFKFMSEKQYKEETKMASTKKCDRCGKFYDEYNFKKDDKNINGIMTLNLDMKNYYHAHKPLNLCPSCKDSFEKWLNKKEEKMIKIPEDHIQQYLKIFGTGIDQIDILQEECAELIKALGKYKRSVGHFTNVDPIDNIVEEMTHVAISSEIVARILNINPEDIQREVNKKAAKYNLSKEE